VAVVIVAATLTVVGMTASGDDEESVTFRPPTGAGEDRVRVAVEVWSPTTLAGDNARFFNVGASTCRVAVLDDFPFVALMVADEFEATALVTAEKVAVVAPFSTVMVDGTVTVEIELESLITKPAAGAAGAIVTTPTAGVPPTTVPGFSVTPVMD
jgi:hypothetical protein